jgi:hypothetical protein
MPLTLLSQRKPQEIHFLRYKIEQLKVLKMAPSLI